MNHVDIESFLGEELTQPCEVSRPFFYDEPSSSWETLSWRGRHVVIWQHRAHRELTFKQ